MTTLSQALEQLDAIEARAKAATKGPWMWDVRETGEDPGALLGPDGHSIFRSEDQYEGYPECGEDIRLCFYNEADLTFIAAARDDVPLLMAALLEADEWRRALVGLTSSGSEFAFNHEACVAELKEELQTERARVRELASQIEGEDWLTDALAAAGEDLEAEGEKLRESQARVAELEAKNVEQRKLIWELAEEAGKHLNGELNSRARVAELSVIISGLGLSCNECGQYMILDPGGGWICATCELTKALDREAELEAFAAELGSGLAIARELLKEGKPVVSVPLADRIEAFLAIQPKEPA